MTDTPNLGLPYIDGSQAQKHVTHNEALRILDAVVQIGVLDRTRTTPPSSPADGDRHVVASSATGAWTGKDNTIATWQDGAWAFLAPKTGWCIWSAADSGLFVFDGAAWQSAGGAASLDNVAHLGVNMAASSPNLLAVASNAALFAAIDAADGGTGDMRLQVSKEGSANTASVFFSDNFSGRAEFGLVGADTFKLKVSPDGSSWIEAFTIDQSSGNLTLPRGLSLTGVISPAQITADQNNYNPTGLAAASVLQINANAARNISGLASGAEGRCLAIINVGSQPVTLLDESTSSSASNRFSFGGNLTIAAKRAAILRYDGTAARWQAIAGGAGASGGGDLLSTNNLSDLASAATARSNLGLTAIATADVGQVPGIATNTDAAAGDVGEEKIANLAIASAVALTSGAVVTVVSLTLTPGDWDISGWIGFNPGGTVVTTAYRAGIGTATNTMPSNDSGRVSILGIKTPGGGDTAASVLTIPVSRVSIASSTTYYLVARADWSTSTISAWGVIRARRMR